MSKEFENGDIAYICRNIKVKYFDGLNTKTKILKTYTEVKIVKCERISEKKGKYAYYIESKFDDKILKSTHSIPQVDFYTKEEWNFKIKDF